MIFGLNFDHQGGANIQDNFNSINTTDKEKTVWLHFDADSNETREFVDQNLYHLDLHIKRAVLAEQTRPRYVPFENGFLLILRDNLYLTCKKCNSSLSDNFPDKKLKKNITNTGTIGDWLRNHEKQIREIN